MGVFIFQHLVTLPVHPSYVPSPQFPPKVPLSSLYLFFPYLHTHSPPFTPTSCSKHLRSLYSNYRFLIPTNSSHTFIHILLQLPQRPAVSTYVPCIPTIGCPHSVSQPLAPLNPNFAGQEKSQCSDRFNYSGFRG